MNWHFLGFILYPNSKTKGTIPRNFTGLSCRSTFWGCTPLWIASVLLGNGRLQKKSLLIRPQLISPTCQTSIRTHENICTRNTRPDKWTHLHLDFCLTLTLIRSVTSVFTQGCFCFVLFISRTNIHVCDVNSNARQLQTLTNQNANR